MGRGDWLAGLGRGEAMIRCRARALTLLLAGCLSAIVAPWLPGGVQHAGAGPLLISASPALTPAFDSAVTDYIASCGTSVSAPTTVVITVTAPAGTRVSVDGRAAQSGAFQANVSRA